MASDSEDLNDSYKKLQWNWLLYTFRDGMVRLDALYYYGTQRKFNLTCLQACLAIWVFDYVASGFYWRIVIFKKNEEDKQIKAKIPELKL